MLSIINLSTSAANETDRARAIEQFHATALSLMTRGKNVQVSVSARDFEDDELTEEEPDWELKYDNLYTAVELMIAEWANSGVKYRRKMAEELQSVLDSAD